MVQPSTSVCLLGGLLDVASGMGEALVNKQSSPSMVAKTKDFQMVQQHFDSLTCLFLIAPVMASTPASMCTALKTLNDSLSHRRRYMKHNFPINYTIRVHQKEIFKLSNISRMNLQMEELDELVLQRLWFQVNQGVLKKIIRVLSERHPSRSYTAELERRFRDAEGVFVHSHPAEVLQQELPETIQDIWDSLTEEPDRVPESSWRFATPKSLLDNFCQTMFCLFSECFASTEVQQDYCGVSHWRKGRKKDLQPES